MPVYLPPGVYIDEIEPGPRPIEGVPTSTAAFIGETERGPVTPRLVTSYKEYQHWFGGVFGDTKFMPYAVRGFFENGGERMYVCRVTEENASPAQAVIGNFTVRAVGPGSWGKRVYFRVTPGTTQKVGADGKLASDGFRLLLAYFSRTPSKKDLAWFDDPESSPPPPYYEIFDDLVADETSPNYWHKLLKGNSALVELVHKDSAPPNERPEGSPASALTANGADGTLPLDATDFVGETNAARAEPQGLTALTLAPYREVALVYAPGASVDVNRAVITHCENLQFRFAVVDAERSVAITNFQPRSALQDTQYAALYYPWIAIADPESGVRQEAPAGGHVIGVYARTDSERGVFKAPANEILRGVLELLDNIDDKTQHLLNPRGVNAIRQFPERGILVWGACTLSSDPLWKYVSVRRLLIFLERSIYEGTQWVVFEPNDDRLWTRVSDAIRVFLRTQWRLGALLGSTEKEAFFVTCDRTTMSENDILNGRLICEVGVAPVRPAEFVIFRIVQNTAAAQN